MISYNDKLISLLISSAYCAWASNLIGGPPKSTQRFDVIRDPRAGDLAMEVSSIRNREYDRIRIGYLERVVREPYAPPAGLTIEEYQAEYAPDPIPTEDVWYIRLLADDTECRWTNCRFIRVMEDWREFP
jgi:hypothetical protein